MRWLAPLLVALSGCGLVNTVTKAPGNIASAVSGEKERPPPTPHDVVQAKLMRFGDIYAAEISQAVREFAARANTPAARMQAYQWRIDYCGSAWRLASGPFPYERLFDTILVIGTLRTMHEERFLSQWGEADQPIVDSLRQLESASWSLAKECLTPEQLEQFHTVIDGWLAQDPAARSASIAQLPSFEQMATESTKQGELGRLFSLDPLSGLEPAMREVAQARQLSERAMYYVQRMPELLASRIELLTQRTMEEPALETTVDSVARVSRAADSLAQTAASLPAVIEAQRAGLVRDLETARAPLNDLLDRSRSTLEAGNALSTSLTETLRAFDTAMARFEPKGEPRPEPKEPGRPFDIREYTAAAEQAAQVARELGVTLRALDEHLPKAVDEVALRSERSIDHVFWRAIEFLIAALVGGALTVIVVRRFSPRRVAA